MSFALPTYHFDDDLREVPDDMDKWKVSAVLLQDTIEVTDAFNEHLLLLENLGFVLRVLGRLDEAEAKLKEAIDMSSSHPNPLRLIQNMLRLAHVHQWQKKYKEANVLFKDAKKLLKKNSTSEGLQASYHQHYGKLLFDQEKYKDAEAEFAKALEIRESIKAPQDQISSSTFALEKTRQRNEATK